MRRSDLGIALLLCASKNQIIAMNKKVALIVLDGWGLGELNKHNAIHMAKTPFFDSLWNAHPHTTLHASGEFVGLPSGQIGGSEVGHLTIGAGRVMFQDLPRISRALEDRPLDLDTVAHLIQQAKKQQIHLVGLLSAGGIHSHQQHLFSILRLMASNGCKSPIIHVIADGRDTAPRAVRRSLDELFDVMREVGIGRVATLSGRFYAMDRDMNLDRTAQAIDVVTGDPASHCDSKHKRIEARLDDVIESAYAKGVTDEFLKPVVVDPNYKGLADSDLVFCWNFRSDRMKQLVSVLHETVPDLQIITMTRYDRSYPFPVLFSKESVTDTLGEVLSHAGKVQVRAAETEKYAHVTYFFNGGEEVVFEHESRLLTPSNKVRHNESPHMKAHEIAKSVHNFVASHSPDFILINFANPDMVGHTGDFDAVVTGVETVDDELQKLCAYLTKNQYVCCITADHGNADIMFDVENNVPHTAHTMNKVPFIIYDPEDAVIQNLTLDQRPSRGLQHIAATVLELMGIPARDVHEQSLILHD